MTLNTPNPKDIFNEEWFTVDDIELTGPTDRLYCLSVDSPDKQFQIGQLGVPTHNTDEAKEADEMKGEAIMIIGSIARLGRGLSKNFQKCEITYI